MTDTQTTRPQAPIVIGPWAYYISHSGNLYRAQANNVGHLDPITGMGANVRWEAPAHLVDEVLDLARRWNWSDLSQVRPTVTP